MIIDGFLNRETRDGLSTAEQAYLHDTFKYTGGGLVLTALGLSSICVPSLSLSHLLQRLALCLSLVWLSE